MSAPGRHHAALQPGYRLHWYRIDSVLGQGGFGITYLARDKNLDQMVAIKEFLPTDLAVRTQDSAVQPMSEAQVDSFGWGLDRFISEAQTLARFQHPNIVVVHSVFEANNTAYMVMAYVEGETLEDALKFQHIGGEAQILEILHPLLDGLEVLHSAGYIHRDIKPDNIYIRKDRSPVLLDFGSARQSVGAQTRTLTALVSPRYAPFEQYGSSKEKDRQGPWTDIYALGATLYRAVIGRGPADAIERANELMSGGKDILIPALGCGIPGYSDEFLRAIDHAMEFLPAKRPQTVAEWRSELPTSAPLGSTDDPADVATKLVPEATTKAAPDIASTTEVLPTQSGANRGKPLWIVGALTVATIIVGGFFWAQTKPLEKHNTTQSSIVPVLSTLTQANVEEGAAQKLEQERVAVEARVKAEQLRLAEIAREQEAARVAEKLRLAEAQRDTDEQVDLVSAASDQQHTLDKLLARGEENLNTLRLTSPKDDNAYENFHAVLAIDSGNQSAQRGMRRIVEEYVKLSGRASASASFEKAERYLDKAEEISPGAENIEIAREELSESQSKHQAAQLDQTVASIQPETSSPTKAPASAREMILHAENQIPIQVGNNNGDWGTDLGYRDINPKKYVGNKIVFPFNVDMSPSRVRVEIKTADLTSSGSCFQYLELNDYSERLRDDGDNGVTVLDIPRGNIRVGQNTLRIISKSCQDEKVVVNDFVIFRVVVILEP